MKKLFIESSDQSCFQPFKLKNPEIIKNVGVDEYQIVLQPMLFGIDINTEHTEKLILGSSIVCNDTIIDYYYSLENDKFNRQSTLSTLIAGGVEVYVRGSY